MSASPLSMVTPTSATAATGTSGGQDKASLEKAAKAFEAVFVRQLMKTMRSTGFGDDLTGSNAVEQFQEMSDARTADAMADRGGLGIASLMMSQLAPSESKAAAAYAATANKGQGE